jgi:predicted ATPase/DNA-binding CsgD family transcriptional regulator
VAARERRRTILRESIEAHSGHVFNIAGDAFCAAFATASDGLAAALDGQRALHTAEWGETPIRVRMGLHSGSAESAGDGYRSGPSLNRVAQVMALAHGGQILLSQATAELVRRRLPEGAWLRDMGEHRLKGLPEPERILHLVVPDLRDEFPPLKSASAGPNNLPLQLTSFIGRGREIAEIKRLLTRTRLLTLTGSGGTGKTRLSLQVAGELLDAFPDGVWFVELAPLADPAFVPSTLASVLSVPEQPGRPLIATLTDYLRDKHLLLILDNCEHLIEASARLADALLHAVPLLKILTSSREALGIGGEVAWRVPSLEVPNPTDQLPIESLTQYAAVRLFVERAALALPTFALTPSNAPAVAQVCRRLDGMPLAIELAATRVKALSAEQIAARLDDRFRLLTTGSRTAVPRQQTLRAAMDWSYGLLTEPERVLLRRLSVFAGGWTLDAAEEVCADDAAAGLAPSYTGQPQGGQPQGLRLQQTDVLDLLTRLVEKSLVVAEEQAGEARHRMLETIRQYAREKLLESDETNAIRDRHLSFFLRLAEDAEPHLIGAAEAIWFARLERDYANLRAAYEWSLQEPDASHGMRLASALFMLWNVRGGMEGVDWLVRSVSRPEAAAPSLVRANALHATAHLLRNMGETVRSIPYVEESLVICRALEYQPGVARALYQLGVNAMVQGDLKTSKSLLEQSLAIREGLDSNVITFIYFNLGLIAAVGGDYDATRTYAEQAMTVARAAESSHGVAIAFVSRGILAFLQGDYDDAEAAFEQGLNAGRAIGNGGAASISSRGLAYVALQRRQVERAAAMCRESLLIHRERRDSWFLAASLAACAALAVARGQPERSARLYGSAAARLAAAARLGGWASRQHRFPHDQAEQERHITILRSQLDEATFNAAWEAGYALTVDQAVAEAEQMAQPERSAAPADTALANPAGLTARELDVLRLVAGGLSDILVAERLVISRRTVSTHLTAIYGKLGVNSRSAATRYAIEHHLT